jgi:UDPglucose 6-dehydrogenase
MFLSTKAVGFSVIVKALGRLIPFASCKKDEKRPLSSITTTKQSHSEASSHCTTVPKKGCKHIVQIGCGVVGSAYMKAFQCKGHKVTGVEASPRIINNLSSDFRMYHVSDDNMSEIFDVDLILICVPTPCKTEDGRLDMSYIYGTLDTVTVLVRNNPNSTVVIRSTVTPGTVCEYKKALNDQLGDQLGNQQVEVLFQPEFLRASSAYDDVMNPWYVVIGTHGGADPPTALYDIYLDFMDESKIKIMSVEEAELLKIFHNSFNACKISFFNQCNLLCREMSKQNGSKIDTNAITNTLVHTCEGLRNAEYGTMTGHGYYGACLPKDSSELKGLEAEYGLAAKLYAEVVNVNDVVVSIDKMEKHGETLDGDFHKPPFALME